MYPVVRPISAVVERPTANMRAEIAGCFLRVPVRAVRATGGAGGTSVAGVFSNGSLISSRRPRPHRVRDLHRRLVHVLRRHRHGRHHPSSLDLLASWCWVKRLAVMSR